MSEGDHLQHSFPAKVADRNNRLSGCESVALRSLRETSPLELITECQQQPHKHISFSVSDPCCRSISSGSSIQALRGYTPPPTSPLVVAGSPLSCSSAQSFHSPPLCGSSSSVYRSSHGVCSPGSSPCPNISTTKVPLSSICTRRRVPTPLFFHGMTDPHAFIQQQQQQQGGQQASPSGSVFSPCYLSSTLDAISPTVLLSPVLSRPVRSQSAASSPFKMNRSMSGGGSHPFDSFSESELTPGAVGGIVRSRANSRTSRLSETSSTSPLASTPPSRSPVGGSAAHRSAGRQSGSFSRHLYSRQGGGSGSGGFAHFLPSASHSVRTIARQTSSQHGSLSQNDSFESTGSGGHALPPVGLNPSSYRGASTSLGVGLLQRSHSDAQECRHQRPNYAVNNSTRNLLNEHHLNRVKRMRRRPSNSMRAAASNIDFLNTSLDSNCSVQLTHPHMSSSSANLQRWRLSPLGHSDPQLYTATLANVTGTSSAGLLGVSSRRYGPGAGRRSFLSASPLTPKLRKESFLANCQPVASGPSTSKASQSPVLAAAHPHQHHQNSSGQHTGVKVRMRSSTTSMHTSTTAQQASLGVGGHQHLARASISGAASSAAGLRQPIAIRSGSSLAAPVHFDNRRWSLASLPSSSGYGTPGSNSNSAFSSQYSSQEHLADMMADLRVNSRFDSNESYSCFEDAILGFRPRSRSLNSPHGGSEYGHEAVPAMSSLYKERFPKAKAQMENKLQQFLLNNAPLSGFTTSMILNVMPPPVDQHRATSPGIPSREFTPPSSYHHRPSRPSSPRPSSPIPRPVSPLVTDSATAIGDAVLKSSAQYHFGPTGAYSSSNNLAISPGSSFVYAGGNQLNAGGSSAAVSATNSAHNSGNGGGGNRSRPSSNRCSFMVSGDGVLSATDPSLLRLISEGATRFLHHQICEIVADCLQKSREDLLTCAYFCNMSVRLDETLAEAEVKTGPDSYKYLARLVKQILMNVSRAARLLECLEFDPDEFYHLLEEAEGAVRVQLGSGTARVPDLPQYIVTKLGLNKNLLIDQVEAEEAHSPEGEHKEKDLLKLPGQESTDIVEGDLEAKKLETESIGMAIASNAPKEEDFESIRLISNGAYGAVYLVRHKKTRQRFALKKMKKTTLLLRNQVDQVYAERDILTFTDNPFVVCFYGSFETKQHLCMLMEYVEGGDCAALLKSAGTMPIELARLYVAETVLAIEYLHSCGIVHRDLKPDNLLITAMGHIKLTDFGLSKIGLMNRTTLVSEGYLDDTQQFKDNQLCGTPEYIAPEVILRQGYGKPVDWWALGIILYEFLIGIVPFMGDSPEELFANIINEEVDYPTGEEALDPDAESLIRLLLEKNPVDRLGTVGGATQVTDHPFFNAMDFDSLLRQKAEFIPQLENEEDTSYFDSRVDRYNHEAESADEGEIANVPMFWSFSTASPRHSIVGMELPPGSLANLQAIAAEATAQQQEKQQPEPPKHTQEFLRKFSSAPQSSEEGSCGTPSTTGSACQQSAFSAVRQQRLLSDSQDSQGFLESGRLPPSSGSIGARSLDGSRLSDNTIPIPSAVILRRRFSTQRHANLSTSSSGTGGAMNTCSSTDSSMDASCLHFMGDRRALANTLASPLPRFAISPCEQRFAAAERHDSGGAELSPVEESGVSGKPGGVSMEKRPSTVVHELITDSANKAVVSRSARSASCRSDSLRVVIPSQHPSSSTSNSPAREQTSQGGTCYYHSYAATTTTAAGSSGQLSPSCNSVSSISSFDSQSPNPSTSQQVEATGGGGGKPVVVSSSLMLPTSVQVTTVQSASLGQPTIHHPPPPSSSSKPIVIRKGLKGYGFTIRSVRVYLSQESEYYTIEHIVAAVRDPSPAFEAGLRENDLITHIHTQSVHNMTHPQLMHRLLSCGNEITLHVMPLNNTSIKEGEARKNVGKLLRKKTKKPQRRAALDKKPRKSSALLRRLSGKRTAGDIVPGTSSQKQTFMPRSVSSQEGVLNVSPACATKSSQLLAAEPISGLAVQQQQQSGEKTSASSVTTALPLHQKHSADSGSSRTGPVSLQQKRLSDFGVASCVEGSNFHHQQQQSPLVASSTSASSTITLSKSSSSSRYSTATQQAESKHGESVVVAPSRPSTLQGLKNKMSQHLAPNNQPSSSTGSAQQPLTRKSSGGGANRTIPLSPLARQSSGSVSAGSQPGTASQQPPNKTEIRAKETGKAISAVAQAAAAQTKAIKHAAPRKMSPSRIVQRFFRGASKDVSSSQGESGNSGSK